MAVDEALHSAAVEEHVATLRLYAWSEPTLSLGYFQRYADRQAHAASRDCAVVRRHSGGGAILHDRELTYSITLPPGHALTRDPAALYEAVHATFRDVLMLRLERGVAAAWILQVNDVNSKLASRDEPWLCFARRAPCDLLLVRQHDVAEINFRQRAYKILGSAQRRHRGAILQHGSLLLERSTAAPELPGWRDLTGINFSEESVVEDLTEQLAQELRLRFKRCSLPAKTEVLARDIERTKFAATGWTERR